MTRKRKRAGNFDLIDIDRLTREVDYTDCETGCVYNEYMTPLKIASYLQTIYNGKAMATHSSSEELHRYEERIIDAKCTNSRRKPGRKTSERSNRCRRGIRYSSDMKYGRRMDDLIGTKNRTSYSSGDTVNYEENRRMNKYFEDIKRLERRYEKLFKKQTNKISILTEMCQQCLEQCSKMSQVIEHNKNNVKVEETGNFGRRGHKLNGKQVEFRSVEDEIKKASGDNINCSDGGEMLAMEKYYEKLAQKLEELKYYFDMKTSCDKFDNVTCVSCKKDGIVSSEILSGVAFKSDRIISIKKSDKAIATDFGKDGGDIYVDEPVFQESIHDLPNDAERPYIQNYFTNMYCSVILDNTSCGGVGSRTRQQNAERRTDPNGHDGEEFVLRDQNWQQIALRVLLAADIDRSNAYRRSNSCLKMHFPELFPLSEEASAERLNCQGGNLEIPPQMSSKDSSFNLDDPIELYEQCRQFHQHREFKEAACKSHAPSICDYLRDLCRRGTAFCEQVLCCRLR